MTNDEKEFLISQYLDGTANELDRSRVEEILATDADARAMLSEFQRLNVLLKTSLPLPETNWNEFAAQIGAGLDELDLPVRHYKLKFATWSKVAALAAMVAIIVGTIVTIRPGKPISDVGTNTVAVNSAPVDVQISAPLAMANAAVSDIQIGQPAGLASTDFRSAEAVVSVPSSIWIASGTSSGQDSEPTLY